MNASEGRLAHNRMSISGGLAPRQIGLPLALGIILGLGILVLGPFITLGAMMGLILVVAAFTNPEIVILIILGFVSGLVPAQLNISINLVVGHFFATDLLLILLLAIVIIRLLTDKTVRAVKTPLDMPLLLFCGAAIVGMGTAVLNHGITFSDATYEARIFLYYLIFFAVTNAIRTRTQLVRLIYGILLIGILTAGMMMLEIFLGWSPFRANSPSAQGEDLVRLYNPGFVVTFVSLIALICDSALRKDRQYRVIGNLLILVLGIGLLTTLGRNILVTGLLGLFILFVVLPQSQRTRLAVNLLGIACVAGFGIAVLTLLGNEERLLQYLSTYVDRISRMFSAAILSPQENLLVRWQEIEYAWVQIVQNPVLGIGFETAYRPAFFNNDSLTHFIHNGYLWIWLKTGLLGLIPFLWLSFLFLMRGFQHWRDSKDTFIRAMTLGFPLAYLALMFSNLVAPSFVQDWSAMIFGLMMGINEVIFAQASPTAN